MLACAVWGDNRAESLFSELLPCSRWSGGSPVGSDGPQRTWAGTRGWGWKEELGVLSPKEKETRGHCKGSGKICPGRLLAPEGPPSSQQACLPGGERFLAVRRG